MGTSELGFCTYIMGTLSLRSLVNPAGDLRKYLAGCTHWLALHPHTFSPCLRGLCPNLDAPRTKSLLLYLTLMWYPD